MSRLGIALLVLCVLISGFVLGSVVTADPTPTEAIPSVGAPTNGGQGVVPVADVAGDDLSRLPRYPASVRTEYGVTVDDRFRLIATEYVADASLDDVRAFYQGVIEDHGWQRADINYSGNEWTYVLVDGSTEALIEIELTDGLVEIDLQSSEPTATPRPEPTATPPATPRPTATPVPAAPPPPVMPPDDDEDDDGGEDDGDSDDDGGTDD